MGVYVSHEVSFLKVLSFSVCSTFVCSTFVSKVEHFPPNLDIA